MPRFEHVVDGDNPEYIFTDNQWALIGTLAIGLFTSREILQHLDNKLIEEGKVIIWKSTNRVHRTKVQIEKRMQKYGMELPDLGKRKHLSLPQMNHILQQYGVIRLRAVNDLSLNNSHEFAVADAQDRVGS
jgi:hypothetical protein